MVLDSRVGHCAGPFITPGAGPIPRIEPRRELAGRRSHGSRIIGYRSARRRVVGADDADLPTATLTGRGWAVGALLRPAGVAGLVDDPGAHVDASASVDAPDLAAGVGAAMADPDDPDRHARAVEVFTDWLADHLREPTPEALLANLMADLLMSDPTVLRLDDAARGSP